MNATSQGKLKRGKRKKEIQCSKAMNLLYFFSRIVSEVITLHPWLQSSSQQYEPSYL